MTSNENLNSRNLRAQSQQGDTEIGGSSNGQSPGQQNPSPAHNPSLLPESYLRSSAPNQSWFDNQSSVAPASLNQEQVQGQGQASQPGQQEQQEQQPHEPTPSPGAAPVQDQAQVAGKEGRVPTLKRPEELPIDCTIQMRGRTLRNQDDPNQVPWEKSSQQEEPEEKILPLPVKPPPSATNNRLAAMQLPADSKMIQSQVEQAASSGFEADFDTTASRRQAVRYKPGAPSPSLKNTTSSGMPRQADNSRRTETPPQSENARQSSAPRRQGQRQSDTTEDAVPRRNPQKQFYSEDDISPPAPARARVNPNLLKSSGSTVGAHTRNSYDEDVDYNYKASGDFPKLSWSEMSFLLKFYFREARSLLINPYEFFTAHIDDTTLGEPIAFMVISSGIAAIFMSLGGDLGGGLSTLFGTSAYAVIAAIAVHYAMDFLNTSDAPKGELKSTFKIMAYAQAPLLVAWIKLGVVPAGWWVAFVYSIFLCIVGLEQVYGMSRSKSMMIMIVVAVVVHGILHMVGM
jgi:hypothetical protein